MSSAPGPDSRTNAFHDAASDLPVPMVRAATGGVLMGLANLVPGISGGTMLLAAGVYPAFINAIAELSTLRLRLRPILLLGVIAGSAAVAILLLAGLMKDLVVEQRWVMYSLFIGLTLGGVPLVWRLARPNSPALIAGAAAGFGLMLLMQLGRAAPGAAGSGFVLLLLSGLAGSAAMILPGVSGGYLLLLLGQYERILGAIDQLKTGLLSASGTGPDLAMIFEPMGVLVPVGIGVVLGVVGVSNLLKWLLARFAKPTLGALLGLLLGAVVGLWPFQTPSEPQAGERVKGRILSAAEASELPVEDWRMVKFRPSAGQAAGALGLVLVGLGATLAVDRLGGTGRSETEPTEAANDGHG